MKIDLNNLNCFCVCLDKRFNKWKLDNLQKWYKIGIKPEPFLCGGGLLFPQLDYSQIDTKDLPPRYKNSIAYPAWTTRPNAFNCWKCHNQILTKCYLENICQVLLLEDDAFPEEDFIQILSCCGDFLLQNNVDMLYFGWYSLGHLKETANLHIFKMNGGGGWHGVLINNKKLLKELADFSPIGPYDWICGQYIHSKYNCYAIYPSIISQENGFSYVEGNYLDKPDRYKK